MQDLVLVLGRSSFLVLVQVMNWFPCSVLQELLDPDAPEVLLDIYPMKSYICLGIGETVMPRPRKCLVPPILLQRRKNGS